MNDAHVPVNPFMPDDPGTPEELASLYAAGAMSVEEAAAFESRVRAGDEAFVTALRKVTPVIEALQRGAGETTPPSYILGGLLSRIDSEAGVRAGAEHDSEEGADAWGDLGAEEELETVGAGTAGGEGSGASERLSAGIAIFRASTARWRRTGLPGVRMRTLLADRRGNRRTIMLEMAPGSALPDHEHAGIEEVFMVSGDLSIAGTTLRAGDYIRIQEGAEHGVPVTPSGCVCIVISNYVPFPMKSLLGFVWTAMKALVGGRGK